MQPNAKEIARFIDHTILKADTTSAQILTVCKEALENGFFGVCVNSCWLPLVVEKLSGSMVAPVAVIGFPLGAMSTEIKAAEAKWCVENGAKEIDMVLNVGQLKDNNSDYVLRDICAVVEASKGVTVKVILETALLTQEQKVLACELAMKAGAHFVKTCTGFGGGSATVEDILLMRKAVGPSLGVKASGGVKDLSQAMALIAAGATRIGTSSGVAIIHGLAAQSGY